MSFGSCKNEVESTSLVPDSFPSIENFLMKFKSILQGCGKVNIDQGWIYLILSKVWGKFHIFSSTFHSTMDGLGSKFTMPTFKVFCDQLARE